mgnify:CR=1 FL=1
MRFVFVIATLFTINFIYLMVLRKWGMSEKVDKGIMMWYGKLSYRRKFIRTLWLIPWAVASLVYIQIAGKNYVYTMIAGIIYIILLPIQVVYNYKKLTLKFQNEEKQMADWLIQHIPQTTEKFLIRSETDGVEAKK